MPCRQTPSSLPNLTEKNQGVHMHLSISLWKSCQHSSPINISIKHLRNYVNVNKCTVYAILHIFICENVGGWGSNHFYFLALFDDISNLNETYRLNSASYTADTLMDTE